MFNHSSLLRSYNTFKMTHFKERQKTEKAQENHLEEIGLQLLKFVVRNVQVLEVLLELEQVPIQLGQVVVVET